MDSGETAAVEEAVREAVATRAPIEQVKGMLMLTYGITADHAFEILKWQSQDTNTRVRKLAVQLIADFTANLTVSAAFRKRADHLLLTAHRRVLVGETDE